MDKRKREQLEKESKLREKNERDTKQRESARSNAGNRDYRLKKRDINTTKERERNKTVEVREYKEVTKERSNIKVERSKRNKSPDKKKNKLPIVILSFSILLIIAVFLYLPLLLNPCDATNYITYELNGENGEGAITANLDFKKLRSDLDADPLLNLINQLEIIEY